jgi:hypothetical protein
VNAALAKLLKTGASGYRWAAATEGSDSAASLELGAGGVPVMAIGGFSGTDPTPTLAAFEQMVASHEIHYFVAGAGGGAGGFAGRSATAPVTEPVAGSGSDTDSSDVSRGAGGTGAALRGGDASDSSQVTSWVESHYTAETVGGTTVYNLAAPATAS